MTPFSSVTAADFQAAAQGLMPRGRAWPRSLLALLSAFLGGVGDAFFQLRQAVVNFLDVESDPAQAIALLPDWEYQYGLPDSCSPANPTIEQRHASLLAKIAATPGGQSADYYIGVAAQLGYTITITTWRVACYGIAQYGVDSYLTLAWRFAWRVNAPSVTVQYAKYGVSVYGDAYWSISDTELECRLSKLQPAYGILWFKLG